MRAIRHCVGAALAILLLLQPYAWCDDWPEWRGVRRDGVSLEEDWLGGWPEKAEPNVLWRAAVGKGHSAISVSQGKAYTMGWDGRQDTVYCFDATRGNVLWKQSYECKPILQWPGPRATPTVRRGRVYTLGQHGQLNCYEGATGSPVWSRQLPDSYKPDVDYGFAWSPLIEGEHLILSAGKRGLALRTRDGSFAWGDDGEAGSCASPVRFESAGVKGVAVVVNNRRESVAVVGVDPQTGAELWRSLDWPEKWGAACVDPLVVGGKVFLTTAEQHPQSARLSIQGSRLVEDWTTRRFACYTGSVVYLTGSVYGVTKAGILKCLDWNTGEEKWAQRGFDGHGALIAAGGLLIVQASSSGDLIVVRADPKAYHEVRRFKVFPEDSTSFTAPVLANGLLYCRSYAGEVVCLAAGRSGM